MNVQADKEVITTNSESQKQNKTKKGRANHLIHFSFQNLFTGRDPNSYMERVGGVGVGLEGAAKRKFAIDGKLTFPDSLFFIFYVPKNNPPAVTGLLTTKDVWSQHISM